MLKGQKIKKYTGEFRVRVIEDMHCNHLSQREAAEKHKISRNSVQRWEKMYEHQGSERLHLELRGRPGKGARRFGDKSGETLMEENLRLRMENDYLKKAYALTLGSSLRGRKQNSSKG